MGEKETREKKSYFSGSSAMQIQKNFEPLIVLRGQHELTVYGCRKILLYTPPEIRLSMRKRQLCIFGKALSCTSFSGGAVTVEGMIEAIRYENMLSEGKEP